MLLFFFSGAIIAGVAESDIRKYSDAAYDARREVEKYESRVSSYSHTVSQSESKIRQTEHDIQQAKLKIYQMAAKLKDLSSRREVVADIQAQTRGAVRRLGELSDVGSVAELKTRYLIRLEAVMKVMEEMTSTLGRITGNELLLTEGITSLLGEIRKNQVDLLHKTTSKDHTEL